MCVQMLESCIGASVEVEFQRMVREVTSSGSGPLPKDAERIVNLARGCTQILDEEVTYFSPLFAGHMRRPAEVAAVRMHHCFNSHLLPWLRTGATSHTPCGSASLPQWPLYVPVELFSDHMLSRSILGVNHIIIL